MRRQWIVLWIAALLVLSLGCALFSGKPTEEPLPAAPTDVQVEQAPDAPVAPPAGAEDTPATEADAPAADEDAPLTFDANALEGLNSYRMDMTWAFTSEDGSVEEFSIQEEATRSPAAQRYIMHSGGESIEFIQIEQTQWMRFGEEWMQTTASEDEVDGGFGEFFIDPDEMFSDVDAGDYKYIGKDNVNGMNARHYQLKDSTWDMMFAFNATDVKEGVIDVWIVDERDLPKFVVRYDVVATGTFEDEGTGKLTLTWNIYDVNAPFTIEAPADVGGLPAGLELCPDASDVMVMGAMSIFSCPAPVADTITFYTEMLENEGWQAGDVTNFEEMLMGTWTKDGETLSLTITADDETGGSSVMLTLGE